MILDDSADNLKYWVSFSSHQPARKRQILYFASDKLFLEWLLLRYKYEDVSQQSDLVNPKKVVVFFQRE